MELFVTIFVIIKTYKNEFIMKNSLSKILLLFSFF